MCDDFFFLAEADAVAATDGGMNAVVGSVPVVAAAAPCFETM